MPIEIVRLLGFDGPNLYGPQPGVLLHVRSDKDRSRRLKEALKDAGQSVGMVVGYLDVTTEPQGDAYLITASFATPTPAIGVELARLIVDGLNAQEVAGEDFDPEGPLWDLQKRRRAEALPLAALQLSAEARSRGIPALVRPNRHLQLGYGARSWTIEAERLRERDPVVPSAAANIDSPPFAQSPASLEVPWEQLGPIPIVAVAGGPARRVAARLVAATLITLGQETGLDDSANFDAAQSLLADRSIMLAVVGLQAEGIAQRGLAFTRCAYSAVTDLPDELPPEVTDREELARVLGVPMLVTDQAGCVVLNADVPEIARLAEFAPCPVVYLSASAQNATIGFHRIAGGTALFVRDGAVIAATGASEQAIATATLPPSELPGALAALAILSAMGLAWDQIVPVFT